jgi:Fe-S-cluster containining protein
MTLQEHIRRYVELVARADRLFRSVAEIHGELMACKPGCDDCCSVYFELNLIEAFYLSGMIRDNLSDFARSRVFARADRVEPLFRHAGEILQGIADRGPNREKDVEDAASKLKIPCPLNEDGTCVLYDHRPITCRVYGTPQRIGDRVVSCPKTGFRPGREYRSVDVNALQRELFDYSCDFLSDLIGTAPARPPGPLFTVPDAVRTVFDKDFFTTLKKTFP